MAVLRLERVALAIEGVEQRADRRMIDRVAFIVGDEVLLADVGDVARLGIFGEEMVKRLVLGRPHVIGDRRIPFVAVGELGVDVEDYPPEIEQAMANDIADSVTGGGERGDEWVGAGHILQCSEVAVGGKSPASGSWV